MQSRRRRETFIGLLVALLATASVVALGGAAASAAKDNVTTFAAKLGGKAIGGDPEGRGTASLEVKRAKRKLCYAVQADDVEKGKFYLGEGKKGEPGDAVLTLFSPKVSKPGPKGCMKKVNGELLDEILTHPKRYFVALENDEYPDGALRGQLRPSSGAPQGGYSATDCYILIDDDTGQGLDFNTGQLTTPTPINGSGVRYSATEDHSVTTCIAQRTYNFPDGTVKVYAKDRLIGSNVYSCVTTGKYKCFGPREGSTTSGYTLRVIYYVCIPGAWPPAYYCPR